MRTTVFRPTRRAWKICYNGFSHIIARMSVWNLPVNTGFPFTTSWKMIVRSSLLILNMLRLSVERKLTRKMRNGSLTCSSMILSPAALCPLLTSASFVTLCVTVSNWPAFNQVKRTVCRTVSRFPISSWETLSRTPSANLLRRYWINFWKIPQILPLTLNLSFTKVWKRNSLNSVTPLTAISHRNRLVNWK